MYIEGNHKTLTSRIIPDVVLLLLRGDKCDRLPTSLLLCNAELKLEENVSHLNMCMSVNVHCELPRLATLLFCLVFVQTLQAFAQNFCPQTVCAVPTPCEQVHHFVALFKCVVRKKCQGKSLHNGVNTIVAIPRNGSSSCEIRWYNHVLRDSPISVINRRRLC